MPFEASADMRTAAQEMRRMFIALLQAEFTESQATQIIGVMLGTSAAANQGDHE